MSELWTGFSSRTGFSHVVYYGEKMQAVRPGCAIGLMGTMRVVVCWTRVVAGHALRCNLGPVARRHREASRA